MRSPWGGLSGAVWLRADTNAIAQRTDRGVAASSALPGVWPPITIDGERYMDGGVRSMLNADLASGHTAVIIVSCFTLALPEGLKNEDHETLKARLNAEIASLRESGARVDVITPSEGFLGLTQFGARMLDPSLVPPPCNWDTSRRSWKRFILIVFGIEIES
ncbi:patatin-like phospholipase family protein [Xanthobacter sp. DSM 24535]|uniref:patatin-like phospholipase family protein n=1 Tax=Roseixanthobacter psychrophilus TaxID=3119917 RepID=UPI0037271D1A